MRQKFFSHFAACIFLVAASVPVAAYSGEMVYIPAGSFEMGSNSGASDNRPEHSVFLSGYSIGKYEVTRGEYGQFKDAGGYSNRSYWSDDGWAWKEANQRTEPGYWTAQQNWGTGNFQQTEQHPVAGVSWYEAEAYCRWAGVRLPTEAEWEKAARWTGVYSRVYPWGDTWNNENSNNAGDSLYPGYQTAPVGSYPGGASPYGSLDMSGNLNEWSADWKGFNYYSETPVGGWVNPTGPIAGTWKVYRGGSWSYSTDSYNQSAGRGETLPGDTHNYIGFRVAAPVPEPSSLLALVWGVGVLSMLRRRAR